jgi:hypothetical protein
MLHLWRWLFKGLDQHKWLISQRANPWLFLHLRRTTTRTRSTRILNKRLTWAPEDPATRQDKKWTRIGHTTSHTHTYFRTSPIQYIVKCLLGKQLVGCCLRSRNVQKGWLVCVNAHQTKSYPISMKKQKILSPFFCISITHTHARATWHHDNQSYPI